jgi:tRNA-guanine family transglycosylase
MRKRKKSNLHFLCAGISNGRLPETGVEGLLISTGSNCITPRRIQETKDMIITAKPKHTMIDSGGYQIFLFEKKGIPMTFDSSIPLTVKKKTLNLAPSHVIEKAIEMEADSLVALDYPIRKIKNPYEQEREFREKLPKNVLWAIETAKLRKKHCPNIKLFIPVQAYNLRQFEVFYEKIKGIDFGGFSLPVRNMSMQSIATFLLKMHEWGVKKVHILGSSSLPVISVCAYMSQRFFDWVSFDATTWRISAQYGMYIHPEDLSSKNLNKVGTYDPRYRCYCKSCEGKTLEQISLLDRKDKMKILVTHNYLAVQNLSKNFGERPFDYQYLKKHLHECKRSDIKRILKCMTEIELMSLSNK